MRSHVSTVGTLGVGSALGPFASAGFGLYHDRRRDDDGTVVEATRDWRLVPFASLARLTQTTTTIFPISGGISAFSERLIETTFGVGLQFRKVVTIRPSMTRASFDGRPTNTTSLYVSIGYGRLFPRRPAKAGEGSSTNVWFDQRSGIYYCPTSRWYGGTATGNFVTEREALVAGAHPENEKRC